MKSYNDINRFLLIIFITTGFWITIETRQVDTQQILSAISWTQLSMEMLITESLEFNCKK